MTNYKDDNAIQKRVAEHLFAFKEKHPDVDWFVIALQGSQNYKLDYEDSDVDTKLLTLPSLDELVLDKKPLNYTLVLEDGTEEHCDIKDVRMYFKTFRKQNINFVEILYTPYWIVNPKYEDIWFEMLANREELVHMNRYAAVSCIVGMAREKYHALCHKYPSKKDIIEKYGYDCYSDDTLFLTNHGWKNYYSITSEDFLGTINPDNLTLEFQPFLNRIEKTVDTTYTIESWYSKFEITENHNLFCSEMSRDKNGTKYIPELANWHLDCLKNNFKMRKGYSKDKHVLSFPYNDNPENLNYSDDFLSFLGAVISEGTFSFYNGSLKDVRVSQTNHGKKEFFYALNNLNTLKLNKYVYTRKDKKLEETIWSTHNSFIKEQCYKICGHGAKEKKIDTEFLLSLSERQCRLILKTMLLGDGTKDKDSPRWIYYTSSPQLSLDILLLAHLAGYEANILGGNEGYYYENNSNVYGNTSMYQVSIREQTLEPHHVNLSLTAKNNSNIVRNNKKTKVVCFEVPNGTLVTMKDGKTACQGNCKQLHHLVRLSHFFRHYINDEPYEDCLILPPGTRTHLIELKRDGCGYTKEEAICCAEQVLDWLCIAADQVRGKVPQQFAHEKFEVYENVEDAEMSKFLDDTLYKLISRSLKEALKEG